MSRHYYLTTPIYYASGDLHIGHSYTTLAADSISRYKRLKGYKVNFLTGTDEHGLKIQRKAQSLGYEPKEYVDKIVENIKQLWSVLNISYDGFVRTTDETHVKTVQWIFEQLHKNGDVYKKNYESWYCVGCESFFTETQAKAMPGMICPDHERPLERVEEESWFFRLSKYQDRLLKHIESHPDFIQPTSRRNEVLQFVRAGLEDLCISRTSFDWGVKVPFDKKSVVYVWVDALASYISAQGYPHDMERFNTWWPADVHLMAKEILRFHAIIWPILLMALDLALPKQIFAHGWLNLGGKKMSKTMGNVIDPTQLVEKYGLDAIRYFVLKEVAFGSDGDYTEEALVARINSDLANDLGNLVYRTLTMVRRFCKGKIPEPAQENGLDLEFKNRCLGLKTRLEHEMDTLHINTAIDRIMDVVKSANKYIDEASPWDLNKAGDARLGTVMYYLCECLRITAQALRPFLINTPGMIWASLGMPQALEQYSWDSMGQWGLCPSGVQTQRGKPLFPRIEAEDEEDEKGEGLAVSPRAQAASEPESNKAKNKDEYLTIDEFRRLDLRVAQILECEKIDGADKLLKLSLDLGAEKRQIVAGIAKHYDAEDLVGKQIIIVFNLRPAVIRGVQSNGMLLAAQDGEVLGVLTPDRKVKNGSRIS